MKTDILVVGGYGHVGGQICRLLADYSYPGRVYAAGRSLERAEQFCKNAGDGIKPLRLDVGKPMPRQLLDSVKLVIMCLDQTAADFAESCLKAGTDYVDVSANGHFFEVMEQVKRRDRNLNGTALLSVGLAPGLTNLLALKAAQAMDHTDRIEIGIMLGLGDAHGKAAIEWTMDSLNQPFDIAEDRRSRRVASFTEGRKTDFGGRWGVRTAYRFPFSDQQTLPLTLDVPSVSTRLCFDSRMATSAVSVLRNAGFIRFLRRGRLRKLAIQAFGKLHYGSEGYAVKIAGYGKLAEYGLQGEREADVTAAAAKEMYEGSMPKGVFHIEQLFELDLLEHGISLRMNGSDRVSHVSPLKPLLCWSRIQS